MFQRLREDVASVLDRDPAARSAFEVLTCYPGIHALFIHRMANACWRRGFLWLGRFLSHIGRVLTGIEIHPGATIGRRVFIDHGMGVVIGETAVIGDDCTLYHGVTLGGTSWNKGKRHPTLESGVVIGAGAKVLGSFTVGEGAKVGSNAVVVKAVPPGATAVGNPARVIEKESEQTRDDAAARMFAAYGLTPNGDDPLSKALHGLIDNAASQELQLVKIVAALKAAGIAVESVPELDKFNPDKLNKLVE